MYLLFNQILSLEYSFLALYFYYSLVLKVFCNDVVT